MIQKNLGNQARRNQIEGKFPTTDIPQLRSTATGLGACDQKWDSLKLQQLPAPASVLPFLSPCFATIITFQYLLSC